MFEIGMEGRADHIYTNGHEALACGAWERARALFEASLQHEVTPETLEGLGMAAWWLDDAELTFEAREGAYRLYREKDDPVGAARMATWLAWDYLAFRGETAVANGWLGRAHRLLETRQNTPEYGWLILREGELALLYGNDTLRARRLGREGVSLGQALGHVDLEMVGLALEGLALVSEGDILEGMRQLDEATTAAVAGELSDLNAMGATCCYLIYACERIRDYDRATQWCARVTEFCKRWRIRSLFAVCRTHYASVLIWRGAWAEAETMLANATNELVTTRPARAFEGHMRLGELRRRQGRWEEAEKLFHDNDFHPFAQLGNAALALDQGDAMRASDLINRFLRGLSPEDRTSRSSGLELLLRVQIALDDLVGANNTLTELKSVTTNVGTPPLQAAAAFAEGCLANALGDQEHAKCRFEDAIDLFTRSGAPFETARARSELCHLLRKLGRMEEARHQATSALELFQELGAERDAEMMRTLLSTLDKASEKSSRRRKTQDLTRREVQVLQLVARGSSNRDIAAELALSEHTVHRHLANILAKLNLSSRAAAVAYAAKHGLL